MQNVLSKLISARVMPLMKVLITVRPTNPMIVLGHIERMQLVTALI